MTNEEKAKAYDEALKRASHVKGYKTLTPQEAAEYIFPQLHESEDEQTRKRLIDFISNIKAISESGRNSLAIRKDDAEICDAFLLYLEKQKEQKPIISDEAIRDGVVHFGITQYQIDNWLKKHINIVEQKPAEIDEYEIIKKHITDDVLSSEVNKRLKECGWYVTDEKPIEWSYDNKIQYDSVKSGIEAFASTYSFNIESKLFPQLTKEQQQLWREEIEQAVIAGGEDGIELARDNRYKENRTTEWSEEDGEKLNSILGTLHCVGKFNFDSWIKSLPERFDFPSKQEWSEADEKHINNILDIIDCWKATTHFVSYQGGTIDADIKWLKSLRPQPKQKWSGKDWNMLCDICGYISGSGSSSGITKEERTDWLYKLPKRFELQPHWKPSEDQMRYLCEVVDAAIRKHNESVSGYKPARVLKSLYEQLQRLEEQEEPEYYQHFDPDC